MTMMLTGEVKLNYLSRQYFVTMLMMMMLTGEVKLNYLSR